MKNYKLKGLTLSFIFLTFLGQAQKAKLNEPDLNRPKLFADMPDRIVLEKADLENLISQNPETCREVNTSLAGKSAGNFSGQVVSTATKYGNSLRSIVIRSSKFKGATVSVSASLQPDGTTLYTGRIISFKHGDLYVLEPSGDQYVLVKKNYYDLISE